MRISLELRSENELPSPHPLVDRFNRSPTHPQQTWKKFKMDPSDDILIYRRGRRPSIIIKPSVMKRSWRWKTHISKNWEIFGRFRFGLVRSCKHWWGWGWGSARPRALGESFCSVFVLLRVCFQQRLVVSVLELLPVPEAEGHVVLARKRWRLENQKANTENVVSKRSLCTLPDVNINLMRS